GQRLPLGLEASDYLAAVHAGLNDLEGDAAFDRLLLLGHVNQSHAALADQFEQLVRTDDRARSVCSPSGLPAGSPIRIDGRGGPFQKAAGVEMVGDQPVDATLKSRIAAARLRYERLPFAEFRDLDRFRQDGFDAGCG